MRYPPKHPAVLPSESIPVTPEAVEALKREVESAVAMATLGRSILGGTQMRPDELLNMLVCQSPEEEREEKEAQGLVQQLTLF